MVRWVKHGGAVGSSVLLIALIYFYGDAAELCIFILLTLALRLSARLAPRFFPHAHSLILVSNTWFAAYLVLNGAPVVMALLVMAASLLSWNAGLFLTRWPDAPWSAQRRYLLRVGGTLALGLAGAFSAVELQGHFSMDFSLALLAMTAAGSLLLRMMLKALGTNG